MHHRGRGNAAESAILNAFVERGVGVLVPFGDGHAYDLVVDLGEATFLRIQCKTAWPRDGCLLFNCRSTDHGRGPQPYDGLADVFGVFFPPSRGVYIVPLDAIAGTEGRLRLDAPRNNQRRRIRDARRFELDRWTDDDLRELALAGPDGYGTSAAAAATRTSRSGVSTSTAARANARTAAVSPLARQISPASDGGRSENGT
jgi:hypothetical protein